MPDQGQDFLSLGLDISSFDSSKKKILQQYIKLFEQLSQYDGKIINPILGPGLKDLNTSISQTNKLLDEINSKLSQFTTSTNTAANATRAAASSSKELTDEQARQKVQIQELNKLKILQAQSENLLVQARVNSKDAIKEQIAAETQLANQQKKDSALIQALLKKQAQDEENIAKQQERDLATITAFRKKDAAERSILIKQQIKEENDIAVQQEKDLKVIQRLKAQQQVESKKSIAQSQKEQAANKLLTNDYYQLTQALKDQAVAYSNLYINAGKNAPETKAALETYGQTAKNIGDIDKQLESAQPKLFGLGKGLSTMYNRLRIIAYILPGIGIAGIFGLAFEAIQAAADALNSLDESLNDVLKGEDKHNKILKEQISILKDLKDAEKEYLKTIQDSRGIKPGETGAYGQVKLDPEKQLQEDEAKGLDAVTIATDKLKVAKDKLGTSTYFLDQLRKEASKFNITHQDENNEELTTRLETKRNQLFADIAGKSLELKSLKDQEDDLNKQLEKSKNFSLKDNFPGQSALNKHDIKTRLENVTNSINEKQSSIDTTKADYDSLNSTLNDFYTASKDASNAILEYKKFISDQERKLYVEDAQSEISVQQNKSSIILSDIRSTHEEKIRTLKEQRNEQIRLNEVSRINVTGTKKNPNVSASSYEIRIANKKEADENKIANQKLEEETLKENIEFYQKQLKAEIEFQKNEVQEQATKNERVQKNDKASLKERLDAYADYITEQTKLQELEFKLASSAGKSSKDDTQSSLTQKEIDKLRSDRDKEIASSKANAEEEIYNIVYSSGQKQLEDIKDNYEAEQVYSKKNLIDDLIANNEKYKRREESLKKWEENKKKIELEDKKDEYTKDLERDEKEFQRLLDLRTKRREDLKTSQVELDSANNLPDDTPDKKFIVDKAKGKNEANVDLLKNTDKEFKKAGDQVQTDRSNLANLGQPPSKLSEWAKAAKEIENELYKDIKSFTDAGYEYKLSMLEKTKAIIDEQYSYEQAAISKSSLSQKDKAALDIQLSEQKREYDKKAQIDERQIKTQQAEFDKKLAIAHIIIGTAAAVIEGVPPSPKSIAAGVVGALELATAIATPIPSFKEGVINFQGGKARYGEAGMEIVKEPGKQARLVMTETISYLPKGTDIIPVKDSPVFEERIADKGWDQTLFLAKEIKKLKQEPKKITNVIKIDLGFETYKKRILGNG